MAQSPPSASPPPCLSWNNPLAATAVFSDGHSMHSDILAIDFGTSNSAAAVLGDGVARRIPIQAGSDTLPTAVFFAERGGAMRIGDAAAEALIAGTEGRYMRALKSALGTPLLHESRLIGGKRRTISDIITDFLVELRQRAEVASGMTFSRALSGRPVRFHSKSAEADAQAEADLRACYLAAGFSEVNFLPEPEAAALAAHGLGRAGDLGLIVDIGGGTSDFSVFRTEAGRVRILASHGIRLGGTDFDHGVSMAHVMPLLGHGSQLKREMGEGLLPVPNAVFSDLATWAKIPFLYTPAIRRECAQMAKFATEPQKLRRLVTVLEDELGHELAFAAEKGKIGANNGTEGTRINMGFIESRLSAPITAESLAATLVDWQQDLRDAAQETLNMAQVTPDQIGSVILVGGSSLMRMVSDMSSDLCPQAQLHRSEAFTAVVDGLALATGL